MKPEIYIAIQSFAVGFATGAVIKEIIMNSRFILIKRPKDKTLEAEIRIEADNLEKRQFEFESEK